MHLEFVEDSVRLGEGGKHLPHPEAAQSSSLVDLHSSLMVHDLRAERWSLMLGDRRKWHPR